MVQMYKIVSGCLLVVICCCVEACHKKQDDTAYTTHIAVSHFILNVDSISVLYDDNKVTGSPSLFYGVTTTPNGQAYLKLGAGTHTIKFMTGSTVLKENILTSGPGKYYSLVLYDSLKNNTIKAALLQDAILPVDTLAQVRFINTIPGTDTLTISFAKDTLKARGSDVYIGKKSVLDYPFTSLRPGTWTVSLIRSNQVIVPPDTFRLQAGKLYSFIARGRNGGTGAYKERIVVVKHN